MKYIFSYIKNNSIHLLLFLIIWLQNPYWPFWNYGAMISFLFIIILVIVFKKSNRLIIMPYNRMAIVLLSIFFVVLPVVRDGFHLSSLLYVLCFVIAYNLNKDESKRAYYFFVKLTAFVLLISLPAWLMHMLGLLSVPMIGELDVSSMKGYADEESVVMENHLIFVLYKGLDMFRFYSVYDEPGVLGTLGAFILYAEKYDLRKWYNLSIFASCIFTFSLAFYFLSFFGYIYYSIKSPRKMIFLVLVVLLLLLFGYGFFLNNEAFSDLILGRLQNLSGSLESRSGISLASFYDSMNIVDYLLGIGINRMADLGILEGASYKFFIIENGLLALIALSYAYLKLNRKRNRDVIVFDLIFIASFLQRPLAFYAWQIFLFTIISRKLEKDDNVLCKV